MILVILVDEAKAFLGTVEDGKYLATKNILLEPGRRPDLLKEISLLIKPNEISGLIAFTGPGAFTSLRVAVAIANAFSFALDIPIVGVAEISNPNELLREGLKAIRKNPKTLLLPFYKKGPNITQPKSK